MLVLNDKFILSYVVKQNQFPHVVLCVLIVCYLMYTLHANMNYQMVPFWRCYILTFDSILVEDF